MNFEAAEIHIELFGCYRVTRRVFSKSVTLKLHILFKKILAGSLKTLKVTTISAMYTNFSHPPVHSAVGHQNFQDQKFEIGLLATQKQIKTY